MSDAAFTGLLPMEIPPALAYPKTTRTLVGGTQDQSSNGCRRWLRMCGSVKDGDWNAHTSNHVGECSVNNWRRPRALRGKFRTHR